MVAEFPDGPGLCESILGVQAGIVELAFCGVLSWEGTEVGLEKVCLADEMQKSPGHKMVARCSAITLIMKSLKFEAVIVWDSSYLLNP